MTKNEVNIDELVEQQYRVPESIFDKNRTKTTQFMLHTLFPTPTATNTLILSPYFVNAFIGDSEHTTTVTRALYLLFKIPLGNKRILPPAWITLYGMLTRKAEFIDDYFCGIQDDKHLIMLIFQVPEKYAHDYSNFKIGAYSKFSADYKAKFNRYTHNEKAQPVESTIWRAVHKSEQLRKEMELYLGTKFGEDDELWGRPEEKFEVYRYNANE